MPVRETFSETKERKREPQDSEHQLDKCRNEYMLLILSWDREKVKSRLDVLYGGECEGV